MQYNRRNFIRAGGVLATSALLFPQIACKSEGGQTAAVAEELAAVPGLKEFGLQLYTLRDVFPDDPKGYLKQVASFGYSQIEGWEGDKGMFWGMGNTGYKSYLDELGLTMVSSHCDVKTDLETKAAQAAEIGMKYLICPWIGPQKSLDEWKGIVDFFNECGETCRKNGIGFAYHNHAYSFEEIDGIIPQDYMMENVDPELVDFQLDIYWVVTGGADPIAYLQKYGKQIPLCHIKDRLKGAAPDNHEASCDVGTGSIDYARILKVAAEQNMEYYILEQERYDNSTSVESAKKGAEYLKQLVFV